MPAPLPIRVRRASFRESAALWELVQKAHVREAWRLPNPRITRSELMEGLGGSSRITLVAEHRGHLAAVALLELPTQDRRGDRALPRHHVGVKGGTQSELQRAGGSPFLGNTPEVPLLGPLAIHPKCLGFGLAKAIVACVEKLMLDQGFQTLDLACLDSLDPLDDVTAWGYERRSDREDWGGTWGPVPIVRMRKSLR